MTLPGKLVVLDQIEADLNAAWWSHAKAWPRTPIHGTHYSLTCRYWDHLELMAKDAAVLHTITEWMAELEAGT